MLAALVRAPLSYFRKAASSARVGGSAPTRPTVMAATASAKSRISARSFWPSCSRRSRDSAFFTILCLLLIVAVGALVVGKQRFDAKGPLTEDKVVNIPRSYGIRDIADLLVGIAGPPARYVTREFPADRAMIDIGSYHADDHAFRAATGWKPGVSLEQGIRQSLDWFRPRLAEYL